MFESRAFQRAHGFHRGLAVGLAAVVVGAALGRVASWTVAMMCRTRLIWRFPSRDSRCRTWSPEEASIGAVPFQEAKWSRSGNRVMSPTSTSSRAAPEGPMPGRRSGGAGGLRAAR